MLSWLCEEAVGVFDGGGEVDEPAVTGLRLAAEHYEGGFCVDGMAFHQDAFGSLDRCAAAKRSFEPVVFGKAT